MSMITVNILTEKVRFEYTEHNQMCQYTDLSTNSVCKFANTDEEEVADILKMGVDAFYELFVEKTPAILPEFFSYEYKVEDHTFLRPEKEKRVYDTHSSEQMRRAYIELREFFEVEMFERVCVLAILGFSYDDDFYRTIKAPGKVIGDNYYMVF